MIHLFEDSSSDSEEKTFQFENKPILNNLGAQNIKVKDVNQYYELFDATKKTTNEAKLLQKLKELCLNQKEKVWCNESEFIEQSSSSNDEDFKNKIWNKKKSQKTERYFDFKFYQYCWNCRQYGHELKMCEYQKQPYCIICLSLNHYFYDCTLNLEKGNLNFEIDVDIQFSEAKCLNCLKIGHINCRFNNIKQQFY
ncbi:unnamed protein product [Paramecium sonneborni]|uniref:CCHC-type domain-containing protein n=1 Tax=Paramecium sonneborni TaxID=65129 RepID=A0A8S1P8A9_9CILI|nr:unnamed protein product [Paramecium sonneborni]